MGFKIMLALTILIIAVTYATGKTKHQSLQDKCTHKPKGCSNKPGIQLPPVILLPGFKEYNVSITVNGCGYNNQCGLLVVACEDTYPPAITQIGDNFLWAYVVRSEADKNNYGEVRMTQYCISYNPNTQTTSGEGIVTATPI